MSAQLEDGYTRIANEILEHIPRFKFNGTQLRIILTVWRYTYGFKRKDHEMSLSFFVKATQLGKTQLDRELAALIDCNVLLVTEEPSYTKPRKIGFNKNFEEWLIECSQPKRVQSAKTLTVSQLDDEQSAKTLTQTVSENADQERYSFKDNLKDNSTSDFEKVRVAYREMHNVLDFPLLDSPLLTSLLDEGIPSDFIISVMSAKHKPSIKTFGYYVDAIRERFYARPQPKQRKMSYEDHVIELNRRKENAVEQPDPWIFSASNTGS